jgi:hypothetical protein
MQMMHAMDASGCHRCLQAAVSPDEAHRIKMRDNCTTATTWLASKKMRKLLNRIFAACAALAACPLSVSAAADAELLHILTCAPSDTADAKPTFEALLKRSTAFDRDGPYLFADPVRAGGACVRNATISPAFGVLSVVAEVCGSNLQPLLELVRESRPRLVETHPAAVSGLIATFEDQAYSIQFFNGPPTLTQAPSPASEIVSYACVYRVSGPQ